MSLKEDMLLSTRSIRKRLTESILLIIGIALGVGAAGVGIAMTAGSMKETKKIMASPEYKQIVVSLRSDSEDMEVPAVLLNTTEDIILTTADLKAAEEAPDIEYAYVATRTRFDLTDRMRNFLNSRANDPAQAGTVQTAVLPDGGVLVSITRPEGADAASGTAGAAVSRSEATTQPASEDASAGGLARQNPTATQESASTGAAVTSAQGTRQLFESDGNALNGTAQDGAASEGMPQLPHQENEISGYEVSPDFFNAWNLRAEDGSVFTADDMKNEAPILVLGSKTAETLAEDGEVMGRKLYSFDKVYTVAGVLEPSGTEYDSMAFSPAFMPEQKGEVTGMLRFRSWGTTLRFSVTDPGKLESAKEQLSQYFTRTYGEDSVVITIPGTEARAQQDRSTRLVIVVLFLSLAGLLIAAVNVSNILLGRALRRQRSVGILKALGASMADIFRLFFSEAFLLSVIGAAGGAVLSVLLSRLIGRTVQFGNISILMLAAGVFGAWIITMALTMFPAVQASRFPAAESMRTE